MSPKRRHPFSATHRSRRVDLRGLACLSAAAQTAGANTSAWPSRATKALRHLGLGRLFDLQEMVILVGRMQVENGERLGAGRLGQDDAFLPGRVSPADAGAILRFGEHAVVDQEIGAFDEADEAVGRPRRRMLDVADVADAAAAVVEAETGRPARMVQGMRLDQEPVGEAERLPAPEPDMLEAARQVIEADREQGRRVKAVEHLPGALAVEVAAIGAHEVLAEQDRLEEGQPADMVEMEVAQENVDLGRRMSAHLLAERRQAGSGIDDDEARPAPDLDASRAAAELGETRPRDGYRPSHAPEMNLEGISARRRRPQHCLMITFTRPPCRAPAHFGADCSHPIEAGLPP